MKIFSFLIMLVILLINSIPIYPQVDTLTAQKIKSPINALFLLDDTLSIEELDHYNIYPTEITLDLGAEFAYFELDSDSVLYIYFSIKNEDMRHYLKRKYGTLQTLQEKLDEPFTKKDLTWINSLFLATGWGFPQGFRFDLGYNSEILCIGLTVDIDDQWSNDPGEGQIGFLFKINLPVPPYKITPYFIYNNGSAISIFGGSDSYHLIYIGTMIPIKSRLLIRPELGVVFTSKYISGGHSIFGGGETPVIQENKTHLGMNLSFEIDF